MNSFCSSCGAPLPENAKFCKVCGTRVDMESSEHVKNDSGPAEKGTREPHDLTAALKNDSGGIKQTVLKGKLQDIAKVFEVKAADCEGEREYDGEVFRMQDDLPDRISPFNVLLGGAKEIFLKFPDVIKNKKNLIPVVALAVIWIVLFALKQVGFEPLPIKILSFLSFAYGGISDNILHMVGGTIGKGIVAYFIMSLPSGETVKGLGGGIRKLFGSFKFASLPDAALFITGAGVALVAYNAMAGFASLWQTMSAISATLLSLRALGSSSGFLRSFIGGLTSKKGNKVNEKCVDKTISGMAVGFLAAVLLSAVPYAYTPYIFGAVLTVAGIVLAIVGDGKKEAAA